MAYDFSGSWSSQTGHQAQLHAGGPNEPSGAAAVAYVKSTGFPSKKILFGVPVYGRSFLGATGIHQSYTGLGGEEGAIEYKDLPSANADEIVDTARVAAFCSGGDGGFVSYDNQETVRLKGQFCKAQDLAVSRVWSAIKRIRLVLLRITVC
jgi:chitinase